MKRFLIPILAVLIVASFCACEKKNTETDDVGTLNPNGTVILPLVTDSGETGSSDILPETGENKTEE